MTSGSMGTLRLHLDDARFHSDLFLSRQASQPARIRKLEP